ncbi:alpha/beta hydrolase family protein [Anaerosacchariphilus polymeriproducens]|nr:alpha/beta fold hydrolase [Anaerosacchariphilus polymeriproducens]
MKETVNGRGKFIKLFIVRTGIVIVVFSIISMIIVKKLYDSNFPRFNRPEFSTEIKYNEISKNYKRSSFQFPSGKNQLQGYIYGQENTKGLVVVAHGISAGSDSYLPQIMFLVDHGWRVLTYDCTGSYDSEGERTRGFPQSILDLDAALTYIESNKELNTYPVMLFGHSWGGYAVANVLNLNHKVDGVISVAGVNTAYEIAMEESHNIMGPFSYILAPYISLYQTMLYGKTASFSAVNGINRSNVPVMIVHGDHDTRVLFNGSSIIAHEDKITNKNVRYLICSKEHHNGHGDFFYSDTALKYGAEINKQYLELNKKYKGNIPYEIKKEFYDRIDRLLINEVDFEFMTKINEFLNKCLEK